jgi:hypothetical protein
MDESELLHDIESYAHALSRTADQHHRERTNDDVASLTSMPTRPIPLRRSVLVAVVLLSVLAAGTVAAIMTVDRSTSSRRRNPPIASTSVPVTRRSTTPTTEACTLADLQARSNASAPTPKTVTHHIAFHSGSFAQIDPPSSTRPAIDAAEAWTKAQRFGFAASPSATYEMLLGDVSSLSVQKRLAWLIIGHHVPTVGSGGPILSPGVTRPPQPPCYFVDLLQPIDATTGQSLFVEAGGNLEPR